MDIITCDPSIYTKDHSKLIVSNLEEESIKCNYLVKLDLLPIFHTGPKVWVGKLIAIIYTNNEKIIFLSSQPKYTLWVLRAIPEKKYLEGEEGTFLFDPTTHGIKISTDTDHPCT